MPEDVEDSEGKPMLGRINHSDPSVLRLSQGEVRSSEDVFLSQANPRLHHGTRKMPASASTDGFAFKKGVSWPLLPASPSAVPAPALGRVSPKNRAPPLRSSISHADQNSASSTVIPPVSHQRASTGLASSIRRASFGRSHRASIELGRPASLRRCPNGLIDAHASPTPPSKPSISTPSPPPLHFSVHRPAHKTPHSAVPIHLW